MTIKKFITLSLNVLAIYVCFFNTKYINLLFLTLCFYFITDCFFITDRLMILHHISASLIILDYFINNYEEKQIDFAINLLAKGEISSIFLSLRGFRDSYILDFLFVCTFLYFRSFNISAYLLEENFSVYLFNGFFPMFKILGIFSLYFLNYYWSFLILRKIFLKVFCK